MAPPPPDSHDAGRHPSEPPGLDTARHPDLEDAILAEGVAAGRPAPMAPVESDTPDTPRTRGLRHAFGALHHRDFALFWTGALISNVGSWMQNAVVPWVIVYRLHGSAAWVGLATFGQFIPAMLVGPVGGTSADRYPRKRILIATQSIGGVVAIGLWALVASGHATPGRLIGLLAVLGVSTGFAMPAWQSFLPQLVPRESMLNAVTLNAAQFNGSRALGPMIAGLVLARFGPEAVFLVNAASYLFVIGALVLTHPRFAAGLPGRGGAPGQFKRAIVYTRRHTGILAALLSVAVVTFLGSPVVTLLAVFTKTVYHLHGKAGYGFLYSFFGLGAVVGAVLLGAYADGVRRSRLASGGIVFYGFAVLGMGLNTTYVGGFVALFAMGLGFVSLVSALQTSIHLLVADEFRGRVMALYAMSFTLSFPVGALVQGGLAALVGVRLVAAVAGALLVVFGIVLTARRDLLPALDEHTHRLPAIA